MEPASEEHSNVLTGMAQGIGQHAAAIVGLPGVDDDPHLTAAADALHTAADLTVVASRVLRQRLSGDPTGTLPITQQDAARYMGALEAIVSSVDMYAATTRSDDPFTKGAQSIADMARAVL